MTIYAINKDLTIRSVATTESGRFQIIDDETILNIQEGASSFSCDILYDGNADEFVALGDFILSGENLFQVLSLEADTTSKILHIEASDFYNWVTSEYLPSISHGSKTIENCLSYWTSGVYTVRRNEMKNVMVVTSAIEEKTPGELLKTLETIYDVEIDFSAGLEGRKVQLYIDIYKRRNADTPARKLTDGKEIGNVKITQDISQAVYGIVISGTSGDGDDATEYRLPAGYENGDFFVSSYQTNLLCSRSALQYLFPHAGTPERYMYEWEFGAGLVKQVGEIEVTSQAELIHRAEIELAKVCSPSVTVECDCYISPTLGAYYVLDVENAHIEARCLAITKSETRGTVQPTFGNHKLKDNAYEVMAKNIGG